jgi:GxxExxY protein
MTENEISKIVVESAIKIHRHLGPGLLESSYQACLQSELKSKGLNVIREKAIPLIYSDVKLDVGFAQT